MQNEPISLNSAPAVDLSNVIQARERLKSIIDQTPLQRSIDLSERYGANIWLKREDLQMVRSYKIRGAFNFITSQPESARTKGIVCASAGNHAQGVAYSCTLLKVPGHIFMPQPTPKQKLKRVELLGKNNVQIYLTGDTYDQAYKKAIEFANENDMLFVHPFDDLRIIEGQGTVGAEIIEQSENKIDYLFLPVGGGGLAAGVSSYIKRISPLTKIIGVEPEGAASMLKAFENGGPITLDKIDKFVDGAAVQRVGDLTYAICRQNLDEITTVNEGKVCATILDLYNEQAIVAEPAGALTIAVLDKYAEYIKGKDVVCVLSGGNNDVTRMAEIKERALIYEGLKRYFIIDFPQRAGALREFMNNILGPNDDITRFEYIKKNYRENGPALVCFEFKTATDASALMIRMKDSGIKFADINRKALIFNYFV